jgi:hypothetical protein
MKENNQNFKKRIFSKKNLYGEKEKSGEYSPIFSFIKWNFLINYSAGKC